MGLRRMRMSLLVWLLISTCATLVPARGLAGTIDPGPGPIAKFQVKVADGEWMGDLRACVDETVYFNAAGVEADRWSYDDDILNDPKKIPDGICYYWSCKKGEDAVPIPAVGSTWQMSFSEAGDYVVTLKVTDECGRFNDVYTQGGETKPIEATYTCSVTVRPSKTWTSTPDAMTLAITSPGTDTSCKPGEIIWCAAEAADKDSYETCHGETGKVTDKIINWKWTAEKGTIEGGGSSAIYTAPASFEEGDTDTMTVSAEDDGTIPPGEAGSRKDGTKEATVQIRLTMKEREWSPTPTAMQVTVASPATGSVAKPGERVVCSAAASDRDHWAFTDNSGSGSSPDGIASYTWSATKGSFDPSNVGQTVTWVAPAAGDLTQGETITFTVTAADTAGPIPEGDTGDRDDDDGQAQATLTIEKTKVRQWSPETREDEQLRVTIQSPSTGLYKGGETVQATCAGSDKDHWRYTDNSGEGSAADEITYSWAAQGGSVAPATGESVNWTLPDATCEATITVTANDAGVVPPGDTGSRDDGTETHSTTVSVDGGSSGYPTVEITDVSPSVDIEGTTFAPGNFTVAVRATDNIGIGSIRCTPPGITRQYPECAQSPVDAYFSVTNQADGPLNIEAKAEDCVGHEASTTKLVIVDGTPPESCVNALPPTVPTASFVVSWSGQDSAIGVGLKDFDVQCRDGNGAWMDWLTATTQTSATFDGQLGHTYYFQCRARDLLDNLEAYPGSDGDTHTLVDDGPPIITIAKPGGDDEYIGGTTFVKAYITDPSGVSWARVYVDNEYVGQMYQESEYWRYDLATSGYQKGSHELKIGAQDGLGYAGTATRDVYCHPEVVLTEISFVDGHPLWNRQGSDEAIDAPQWASGEPVPVTKPFAYTAGSQMSVYVGMESTDITVPVQVMYTVGATWRDRNGNSVATDNRDKWTPDVVTFPTTLAHYPPTPDRVTNYVLDQSYDFYVRRYAGSDWCPAEEANVTHPQVYLTFGVPVGPWGQKTVGGQQVNRTCWSAILDFACQRMPENGYANTLSGKLDARKDLTDGAYWWCNKDYNGDAGGSHCNSSGTSFNMWAFFAQDDFGDCRDMSAFWVKLCNSLGMNGQVRRINPPTGTSYFSTDSIDPIGDPAGWTTTWQAVDWSFHQVGHYENLFDPCIRLKQTDPWIAKYAEVSGAYKTDLLAPPEEWTVDSPFSLVEVN